MAGDAERILQNVPIESYLQRYLQLKRKGNNLWALCPFHSEKSPSFSVSPEKGIFKCFGCGKGGNLITFVQLYEKVEFLDALKLLSEYSGIPLEGSSHKSETSKNQRDYLISLNEKVKNLYAKQIQQKEVAEYLAKRGIREDTIQHFQLGFAPAEYKFLEKSFIFNITDPERSRVENALQEVGLLGKSSDNSVYNRFQDRLIFPIIDVRGKCIAFGGRIIQNKENTGKYVNSPESILFHKKNSLYNLNHARDEIRKAGQVVVVEGYMDVIGLYQAGIYNVVAPLGTAFTDDQARIIKRYTDRVIFFLDNDLAGTEASFKSLEIARRNKLDARVVTQETGKDPFDLSQSATQMDILTILDSARSEVAFILWYFFRFKHNINKISEKRNAIDEFFEHIRELEHDWEKEEYLKSAASVLETDLNSLKVDFKRFVVPGRVVHQPVDAPVKEEKIPGLEKEILSLLLKFPPFWQKKEILGELQWTHKNVYLLYTFFRDRLKAGEFWKWEDLNQAINLLPQDLGNLLAEIMIEMEEVFQNWEQNKKTSDDNTENYFERKLNNLVLLHKRKRINEKLQALQKSLESAEKMQDSSVDSLTEEISTLLTEKAQIEKQLLLSK